jgi:ATP-dependent helicase/nuclease subunit A
MELPRPASAPLTPSQRQAVEATGNVLVMAGAGTGKTKTLVARCLHCLEKENASLDQLLIVTFTEAAAAEMRQRLRLELEKKAAQSPESDHWTRQLALFDTAHIGTLHSFCVRLVREHFYQLELDPQFTVLDEIQAHLLANETLDAQFQAHYERKAEFSPQVLEFIQVHGGGRDEKIRSLVLKLHQYSQTRPDAAQWLADQLASFGAEQPARWPQWLESAIDQWRDDWLIQLNRLSPENPKAAELLPKVKSLCGPFNRTAAGTILAEIVDVDRQNIWPKGKKTKLRAPLEKLFESAAFLASITLINDGKDPLTEDWTWVRRHMATLLKLTGEFTAGYAARKRTDGFLDFSDLEQFALKLLWDFPNGRPLPTATLWRQKFQLVLVDEYQDINAAQDKIIAALARTGPEANRFLVGDVKQSIYRFRLADPGIFRAYAREWQPPLGQTIPLTDNFRSREGLLDFVNSVFQLIFRKEVGGVDYDEAARLKFGAPEHRAALSVATHPAPCVELLLRLKSKPDDFSPTENPGLADLEDSQKEARLAALHLRKLHDAGHPIWDEAINALRPVTWRDMTVLLRSPRSKSAAYVKEFERAGIPLAVERGGFYDSSEILDLLSVLQLLDNPLQDLPCLAVLRSPFVGLTLDQLAEIRLVARDKQFWTALNFAHTSGALQDSALKSAVADFLKRFGVWRKLVRQVSLSQCLETILSETHYLEWLKSRPRGAQRAANVDRFLRLAQQFDQFQRQGLYRFLQFIEAQREIEAEPEVSAAAVENAVRLMSIHQSKGLEFPVVLIADLAKSFNEQDLHADIIFDEVYGLCPRVKPPHMHERYSSLPHWLAKQHQQLELRGEEMRLLYVAFTRARDALILVAGISANKWKNQWQAFQSLTPLGIASAKSFADWLQLWFSQTAVKLSPEDADKTDASGTIGSLHWQLVPVDRLSDSDETTLTPIVPGDHWSSIDADSSARLQRILSWRYDHVAATQRKAKASVTELRRTAEALDDEAEPVFDHWRSPASSKTMSAAEIGTAHHKFLQWANLDQTKDLATLTAEADRLVAAQLISPEEKAILDFTALAEFFNSPLGQQIRAYAPKTRREMPFTASFTPAEITEIIGGNAGQTTDDEIVVVQGVADLVVQLPHETWLIDFKTDAIKASGLAEKVHLYTPQLKLYARALEKIYPGTVTKSWLHFLALGESVSIPPS